MPRIFPVLAASSLVALRGLGAQASAACDTTLLNHQYGAQGYQSYGDRCEGVFRIKRSAGQAIELASFTASEEPVDASASGHVVLAWDAYTGSTADSSSVAGGTIRIRARNFPRESDAYGMDALQPAAAGEWRWGTSMLAEQGITKIAVQEGEPDVGVLAWTRVKLGGVDRVVYVPLRVRKASSHSHPAPTEYRVVLYPGSDLESVSYRISRRGSEGKIVQLHGHFAAEQPFTIAIAAPGSPGLYSLEVTAHTEGGEVTMTPMLFYHPGSSTQDSKVGRPRPDTPN